MTKYFQTKYLNLPKPISTPSYESISSDYNASMRFKQSPEAEQEQDPDSTPAQPADPPQSTEELPSPNSADGSGTAETAGGDGESASASDDAEVRQRVNSSQVQVKEDWPIVLAPTPIDTGLVADEKDQESNQNMNLNEIPKPKKVDTLFTPDIFDIELKNLLYPDEQQGVKNLLIQEQIDGRLEPLNQDNPLENYLMQSSKQFEMRINGEILIQDVDKIIVSCTVLDAPATCTVEKQSQIDNNFLKRCEDLELDIKDTRLTILETDASYGKIYLLQFETIEGSEQFRALTLFNYMKNSQTIKKFQRLDGGEIAVDYNSGLITEKQKDENEQEVINKINVNSLSEQTWDQTKSEVKLKQMEIPLGEKESVETTLLLKVLKEPEGVEPVTDHEFWYAQQLQKNIDSAVNLQQQFQIEQKKDVFLTGIEILSENFNANPPKLLLSYKYPLKLMKMVQNQMNPDLNCLQRASIIVYLAELFSAQNVQITMELLYYQYIIDIFPSVNPTFEGIEYQNWIKFFRTKKQEDDGHGEIQIKHPSVTLGIGHRFLQQINERKCKNNAKITLEDQLDIYVNFSPKHQEWATQPKWEPYRDEISSFVLYDKKPDVECDIFKNQLFKGYFIKKLSILNPMSYLIKMMNKFSKTTLKVFIEFVKDINEYGENGPLLLSDGLKTQFPDDELADGIDGLNLLSQRITETEDQNKIQKMKGIEPLDQSFIQYLNKATNLMDNIKKLIGKAPKEINDKVANKIISSFENNFNALNLQLFDANEDMGLEEMTEINELVKNDNKIELSAIINDKDCNILQDKFSITDQCDFIVQLKNYEYDINDCKIKPNSDLDANVNIESPIQSCCDPEVSSAIGNLDELEIKESIKKTQSQSRESNELECELPKIFLLELTNTGGLNEDQAQNLFEKLSIHSFIQSKLKSQLNSTNKNRLNNKMKMNSKTKSQIKSKSKTHSDNEQISKLKSLASESNQCDSNNLRTQIDQLLTILSFDTVKKALCLAMSHEEWQHGFGQANADLAAKMQGTLEKPWLPLIPPNDYIITNIEDIIAYLSCNFDCLRSTIEQMLSADSFDSRVFIQQQFEALKSLESEDQKTEIDAKDEALVSKEGEELGKVEELIRDKMAPQILHSLLEQLKSSEPNKVSENLIEMLKGSEQCTYTIDNFIKLKSLNKPSEKIVKIVSNVLKDNENNTSVQKIIIHRLLSCECLDDSDILIIKNDLKLIPDHESNVSELINRENLPALDMLQMLTLSQEYDVKIDTKISTELISFVQSLEEDKANCLWNQLITCKCFTDLDLVKKEIEPTPEVISPIEASIPVNIMRQKIIDCVVESETIGQTINIQISNCMNTLNKPVDDLLSSIILGLNEVLNGEAKTLLENMISGSESAVEKIKIIEDSEFGSEKESRMKINEIITDYISNEDMSIDEDITCIYNGSLENDPKFVKCVNTENINAFVMDKDCNKIIIDSKCNVESLKKLTTFAESENGNTSINDCKLSVNEEDCIQDGEKILNYKDILEKSDLKLELFDLKMSIEECNILKIEEDAEEVKEEHDAMELNHDETMAENVAKLTENLAGSLNLVIDEILKDKIILTGDKISALKPPSSSPDTPDIPDGEYIDEGLQFDLTVEKDSQMKTPDNMSRSTGISPDVKVTLCQLKQACDLNFALVFDEFIAKCISEKKCDNMAIKNMKVEFLNIIKSIDGEEMLIRPGDNLEIIRSKLEKSLEFVHPFTAKDDLGGLDDAHFDMTQQSLNKLCAKYGIKTTCTAGPQAFRFMEFMPDEIKEPEPKDLMQMVIITQLYNETVSTKPVYTVALHNKIKKAGNNSLDLPLNVCEGVDAEFFLNRQREHGLMHLALANKVKVEFVNAVAHAIPQLTVSPAEIKGVVDELVSSLTELMQKLNSLPGIFAAVQFQNVPGTSPKQPTLEDLEKSFQAQLDAKKGIIPAADFFMMTKILNSDSKGLDEQPTKLKLFKSVLTVKRFGNQELVFRSLDMVKGIQKTQKGADQSKNYLKQVNFINFMSKGEVFLEYVSMRQENRVKKEKNAEELKEKKDKEELSKNQ